MDSVALIVPCYNEALRLDTPAFENALVMFPWLALVFVDDGSTDNTAMILDAFREKHVGRVVVLSLPSNAGKAEAVRQGLLWVASEREGLCGFWDADLSAPLEELERLRAVYFYKPLAEWVWGIRLRALGRSITRKPVRHYLGRLFATCSSLLLAIESYDTQCGAKLFRISPLLRAVVSKPFRSRWIFDVEMLVRAQDVLIKSGPAALGTVVHEEPLSVWVHRAGSKVRGRDFLRALRELWLIHSARSQWNNDSPSRSSIHSKKPLPHRR